MNVYRATGVVAQDECWSCALDVGEALAAKNRLEQGDVLCFRNEVKIFVRAGLLAEQGIDAPSAIKPYIDPPHLEPLIHLEDISSGHAIPLPRPVVEGPLPLERGERLIGCYNGPHMELDGRTSLVGILGDPVAHSLSPRMHNAAFEALQMNWRYLAFRVSPSQLAAALRGVAALGLVGANVTVPHKEAASSLLDELDDAARQIGAVNTVRVTGTRLSGFNTDAPGLLDALARDGGVTVGGRRCLIIGAGGGGRAAAFALATAGASQVTVLNRSDAKAKALADAVARAVPSSHPRADALSVEAIERAVENSDIIIHATAATMSAAMGGGGGGNTPWLAALTRRLRRGMVVLDMVYTPTWTALLQAAKSSGATAVSGLSLLVFQGARSFELWTGRSAPIPVLRQAVGLDSHPEQL